MPCTLIIHSFMGQDDQTHEFKEGVTLAHGPSGSGKSTIFKAIRWCIFGKTRKVYNHHLSSSQQRCHVELVDDDTKIERKKKPENILLVEKGIKITGPEAESRIRDIYGSEDLWLATSYIVQKNMCSFITSTDNDKFKILNELVVDGDPNEYLTRLNEEHQTLLKVFEIDSILHQKNKGDVRSQLLAKRARESDLLSDDQLQYLEVTVEELEERSKGYSGLVMKEKILSEQVNRRTSDISEEDMKEYGDELVQLDESIESMGKIVATREAAGNEWRRDMERAEELGEYVRRAMDQLNGRILRVNSDESIICEGEISQVMSICSKIPRGELENVKRWWELDNESNDVGWGWLKSSDLVKYANVAVKLEGLIRGRKTEELKKITTTKPMDCPNCREGLIVMGGSLVNSSGCIIDRSFPIEDLYRYVDEQARFGKEYSHMIVELGAGERFTVGNEEAVVIFPDKIGEIKRVISGLREEENRSSELEELILTVKLDGRRPTTEELSLLIPLGSMDTLLLNVRECNGNESEGIVELNWEINGMRKRKMELTKKITQNRDMISIVEMEKLKCRLKEAVEELMNGNPDELLKKERGRLERARYSARMSEKKAQITIETKRLETMSTRLRSLEKLKEVVQLAECECLYQGMDSINEILGKIIGDIFDKSFDVCLSMFKERKSGVKKEINLKITEDGDEISGVHDMSGGEADRVSLGIIIALSSISGGRFLLLDESLAVGEDTLVKCVGIIRSILPGTICVMSRQDKIDGVFDDYLTLKLT